MKLNVVGLLLSMAVGTQAAINYSTDFTGAEDAAWTEGGNVSASVDWDDAGWIKTIDVAGSGVLTNSRASDAAMYLSSSSDMGVGDTWTFTTVHAANAANRFHESIQIGLTGDSGNAIAAGISLFANSGADGTWVIGTHDQGAANDSGTYNSGIGFAGGLMVTSVVTITKSATLNEFDISADLIGSAQGGFSYTVTDSVLYSDDSLFVILDLDESDKSDPLVDSFSVVPEPATLGLVAAAGGAVLFIRRRFMI